MNIQTALIRYLKDRNRGILISLFIITCLVYLPFLSNPFFFDDRNFFSNAASSFLANSQLHLNPRLISNLSLGWTWHFFYDAPHVYHLINLLIHTTNVILIFQLSQKLLSLQQTDQSYRWQAWFSALVFACHPVAVYAVGYVIQQSILLATAFMLGMMISFLNALSSNKNKWYIATVGFYFLAVFSKEHSLMAMAAIIPLTILYRDTEISYRKIAICFLAMSLIGILITLKLKGVIATTYEHDSLALLAQQKISNTTEHVYLLSILTQCGLFFKYLLLWLLPNPAWMSIDIRVVFNSYWYSLSNLIQGLAFLGYGILSLKLLFNRNIKLALCGFTLITPWLLFLTELTTVRIQDPFVLYRSYLWLAPSSALISIWVAAYPPKKIIITGLIISSILIAISWNRLWVFSDNYRLWNDAGLLLKDENIAGANRIFYNRANALLGDKKWEEAILDFNRVIKITPSLGEAYLNKGIALFQLGLYQEALNNINKAIEFNTNLANAYFAKGIILKRLGNTEEARSAIEKSCSYGSMSGCLIISEPFKHSDLLSSHPLKQKP